MMAEEVAWFWKRTDLSIVQLTVELYEPPSGGLLVVCSIYI
jgi:hypothetical protein